MDKVWVVIAARDDFRIAAICASEEAAERWVMDEVRSYNNYLRETTIGFPSFSLHLVSHDDYDIREREVIK